MKGKVYILSEAMVTSLGVGVEHNMAALRAGESGVRPASDSRVTQSSVMAGIIPEKIYEGLYSRLDAGKSLTRTELLAVACICDALGNGMRAASRMGLVIASAKGNAADLEGHCSGGPSLPHEDDRILMDRMGHRIGSRLGFRDEDIYIISNACISGVSALIAARRMILGGWYEKVMVVGVDTQSRFITSGFASFKSLSTEICRPYDAFRCGLNLGEACGAVLLSGSPEGHGVVISIDGGAATDDANHISGPSRTGDGLYFAMRRAMGEAGLSSVDIDMLQMHGTATAYNDEMESKAAGLAGLQNVPLQSLKPYFGHTMGASGVIETIIAAEEMKEGLMLGTKGFSAIGVPVPVSVNALTRVLPMSHCLKTASGFGGTNAAIVLSVNDSDTCAPASAGSRVPGDDAFRPSLVRKVEISAGHVKVDGAVVFSAQDSDFHAFIREAYKSRGESGMKFYKMDDFCKLGYMAAEWLLEGIVYGEEECGIVLTGKYGCLDTDMRHQQLIDAGGDSVASPAVFVYTLPNVVAGEISIRHNIKGENVWLCSPARSMQIVRSYACLAARSSGLKYCAVGSLDCLDGHYSAVMELLRL